MVKVLLPPFVIGVGTMSLNVRNGEEIKNYSSICHMLPSKLVADSGLQQDSLPIYNMTRELFFYIYIYNAIVFASSYVL